MDLSPFGCADTHAVEQKFGTWSWAEVKLEWVKL